MSTINGTAENDTIVAPDTDDRINGGLGDDLIEALGGNDRVIGDEGNDTIDGGAGDDMLEGAAGNDSILGGEGNDTLIAETITEFIEAIDGNPSGNDVLNGGSGNDLVLSGEGNDSIDGGSGNDTVEGRGGNDSILGGAGRDLLLGGAGDDFIFGGDGVDDIFAGSGDDTASGGVGNDFIIAEAGNDVLLGGEGEDYLEDGLGNDFVDAGIGNDSLFVGQGSDTLFGNDGDDLITISGGLFVFDPSSVDTSLSDVNLVDGGSGNDTVSIVDFTEDRANEHQVFFSLGSGHDLVTFDENFVDQASVDIVSIVFDSNLSPEGIVIDQADSGLVFRVLETDETLTFVHQSAVLPESLPIRFVTGETTNLSVLREDLNARFAAGEQGINLGHLMAENPVQDTVGTDNTEETDASDDTQDGGDTDGTEGGDTDGTEGGDTNGIFIPAGIIGTDGDDTIAGETGDDFISGEGGNDFINGIQGNDNISGGDGDDAILGGEGNDSLISGAGQDIVVGGLGDDYIFTDIGNDTANGGEGADLINGGEGNDTLIGAEGNDFLFGEQGDDYLNGGVGNDSVFGGEGNDTLLSDSGDNVLSGFDGNDWVTAGDGNDLLLGGQGDDIIDGAGGNDTISGGLGSDIIHGGAGDDSIIPNEEVLDFATDLPAYSVNIIDGGAGNDTIEIANTPVAQPSEHQIIFSRGSGHDLVSTRESQFGHQSQGLIAVTFGADIKPEDITIRIVNSVLEFEIVDTGETLRVDALSSSGSLPSSLPVRFESNIALDLGGVSESLSPLLQANNTVNLNSLLPADTFNEIQGSGSADTLLGTQADDRFLSGGLAEGVESIQGNGGSDVIVFGLDDNFSKDSADDNQAHIRIRDFTIDDTRTNNDADVLDIGAFLLGSDLRLGDIANYLHIVSGSFGSNRSSIFVDREGHFTDQDRVNLTNNPAAGGNGADLFLEFQGQAANNNIAELTGFRDNSLAQLQALIDLGFLDVSKANSDFIPRPQDPLPLAVFGSELGDGDNQGTGLLGRENEDNDLFSGGLGDGQVENVQGIRDGDQQINSQDIRGTRQDNIDRSGNDRFIIDGDDAFASDASNNDGHIRVRGFTVGDIRNDDNADSLVIGDLLRHSNNAAGFDGTAASALHFLHFVEISDFVTALYIDRDGGLGESDSPARQLNQEGSALSGIAGQANYLLEFRTLHNTEDNVFDFTPNGEALNTVEQIQALIDLGFLDVSDGGRASAPVEIQQLHVQGTTAADHLVGTTSNEIFFSNGASQGTESIRGNGGSDRIVFGEDDSFAENNASDGHGHLRVRDFVIDDTETNTDADVLDLGAFLIGSDLDASNISHYLHIVSGGFSNNGSLIFVDREGHFTDQDRANLSNNPAAGGNGADLLLELQGNSASNNIAALTGFADNSVEQLQTLIDFGFLDVGNANRSPLPRPDEDSRTDIVGTFQADSLVGTQGNDNIFSGGIIDVFPSERVSAIGGADRLILTEEDEFIPLSIILVRGFTIDDTNLNNEADVFDIGQFLNGSDLNASNIGNYLHINSGRGITAPTSSQILISRDGNFTDELREELSGPTSFNELIDVRVEFRGEFGINNNNLLEITSEQDNSIEQFQALIDWGFLDISDSNITPFTPPDHITISGTSGADNLIGTANDDLFLSGGASQGAESILSNGGADTLVFGADDAVVQDNASNGNAHFRIRDFTIDNVLENDEADVLDISDLLSGFSIETADLGDHLHIISGTFGNNRSSIFIDRDGTFDDAERAALDANVVAGGQGADLFLEFQGQAGDNNFERITGFADNTQEQLQALIDLGFLEVV